MLQGQQQLCRSSLGFSTFTSGKEPGMEKHPFSHGLGQESDSFARTFRPISRRSGHAFLSSPVFVIFLFPHLSVITNNYTTKTLFCQSHEALFPAIFSALHSLQNSFFQYIISRFAASIAKNAVPMHGDGRQTAKSLRKFRFERRSKSCIMKLTDQKL